jgi:predicted S18 family serine protease
MKRLFFILLFPLLVNARTVVQPVIGVDSTGSGVLINVSMTIQEGDGIFVLIEPLVKVDTQESIRTAIDLVRGNRTGRFLVEIPSTSYSVEGPSGGAAFALIAKALLDDKFILPDFTVTGTIDSFGRIGQVGGVYEKVIAARNGGIKLVLVPEGEGIQSIYVPDDQNVSALRLVNLTLYAKQEWNISVIEVGDFATASALAFGEIEPQIPSNESPFIDLGLYDFVPEEREYLDSFESMKEIALYELTKANETLNDMLSSLRKGTVEDDPTLETIYALLYAVQSAIETGFTAYEQGYYYTAANYGFLSNIDLRVTDYTILELNASDLLIIMETARKDITELKKRIAVTPVTTTNLQWYAGAVQRAYWADIKLSEASMSVDYNTLRDVSIVQEWIVGSNLFLDYLNTSGQEFAVADSYSIASSLLDDVAGYANSFGDQIDMVTAQFHIDAATRMFIDGNYVGAVFEASEAKAIVATQYAAINLTAEELRSIVEKNFENMSREGGPWYSLYYDHAYYYYLLSNHSDELLNLRAAMEYQLRIDSIAKAGEILLSETEVITPVQKTQTVAVYDMTSIYIGIGLLLTSLLFFALAIHTYSVEKPRLKAREAGRYLSLLDKLDESLASGRIGEASYKRLEKKYITKLKEIQKELKK